jgi:hypothetical protein
VAQRGLSRRLPGLPPPRAGDFHQVGRRAGIHVVFPAALVADQPGRLELGKLGGNPALAHAEDLLKQRITIFSSESVGEGHPDKVSDTISDAILDACLAVDPKSRVACETFVKSNIVVVGGEITIPKIGQKPIGSVINIEKVIRDAVRGIGYVNDDDVFHADKDFHQQLPHHPVAGHRPGRGREEGGRQEDTPSRAPATRASCSATPATRRRS